MSLQPFLCAYCGATEGHIDTCPLACDAPYPALATDPGDAFPMTNAQRDGRECIECGAWYGSHKPRCSKFDRAVQPTTNYPSDAIIEMRARGREAAAEKIAEARRFSDVERQRDEQERHLRALLRENERRAGRMLLALATTSTVIVFTLLFMLLK